MFSDQQLGQFVFILSVVADRQPGHQVDRDKPLDQLGRRGKCENLGEFTDKLCLVQSEVAHIALALSQFTDKIGFAVNFHLQMLVIGISSGDHLVTKLDIGCLTED